MSDMIPVLDGLSPLADGYDGFIVDLWGVLHDGHSPYPGALDTLAALKQRGKRVVLLSNAPRQAAAVQKRLDEMGFPRDAYFGIMTSGEETWRHLAARDDPWYARLGRHCYLMGPVRDDGMLMGVDAVRVRRIEEADFILNTGADYGESLADYEAILASSLARKLPMVCANPDLVVIHRGERELCAGAIAERYEELGGDVRYHGKPHPGVYRACFELLQPIPAVRVLAVGDALRTDIAGATRAGIDSVLVTGGITGESLGVAHGEKPDPAAVTAICKAADLRPRAAIPAFLW